MPVPGICFSFDELNLELNLEGGAPGTQNQCVRLLLNGPLFSLPSVHFVASWEALLVDYSDLVVDSFLVLSSLRSVSSPRYDHLSQISYKLTDG